MKQKLKLLLISFCILICSCQSINRSKTDFDLPKNQVYFLFDDGPNTRDDTTARLLDVLKKYQIKGYFSLMGENVNLDPGLAVRIHDEGHIIVNHGYSDKWAYRMSKSEFRNNLIMGETAISQALGFGLEQKLYQPHGGYYLKKHEKIFLEEGYTLFPASIRVYDAAASAKDKNRIVKNAIKKTVEHGGGIILLHDMRDSFTRSEKELAKNPHGSFNRSWIPDAVEEIIIGLLDKGFVF